jgi:hypothetical protein
MSTSNNKTYQIDEVIIDLVGPGGVAAATATPIAQPLAIIEHGLGLDMSDICDGVGLDSSSSALLTAEELAAIPPEPPRKKFLEQIGDSSDYILYIDNSSLEVFNTCPRRAFYYMILRREPSYPSVALKYGSAVHAGLEHLYKRKQPKGSNVLVSDHIALRQAARAILLEYRGFRVPDDEYRTPDRAIQTLGEYMTNYPLNEEPFELLYGVDKNDNPKPVVEFPFACPLGVFPISKYMPRWEQDQPLGDVWVNNIHIVWTGRIDLPVLWEGRVPTILDHKTTSMMGSTFYDQFLIASQTVGYCWAANQIPELMDLTNGEPFQQFCLNAICTRKITRTGTPYEFGRNIFRYDQSQIEEWHRDVLTLTGDFLHAWVEDYFPKKTAWCVGKYGKCPFLDVDALPVKDRPVMLNSSLFKDVTWNPLLVQRGE